MKVLFPIYLKIRNSIEKDKKFIIFGLMVILQIPFPISICLSEELTFTNRELIRNGDFEEEIYSAWFTNFLKINSDAAFEGENGLSSFWCPDNESDCYFAQKLPLPSQLESATLSFEYRVERNEISDAPVPINLQVYLATSSGFAVDNVNLEPPPLTPLGDIYTAIFSEMTEWRELRVDLDASLIQQAQTARSQGEFVFIVFVLETSDIRYEDFEVHFDNVSFLVNGTLALPSMQGAIAFFETGEEDPESDQTASIHVLDPAKRSSDGNFNQFSTVWNSPHQFSYAQYDVSWNPEGTRIAFISDHDSMFSPFYADIYTIAPDGEELEKVTSPPMQSEIESGDFPSVTVSGTISNTAGNAYPYSFYFCLQGAPECVAMNVDGNSTTDFTINDVALLGDSNVFDQHAVIYWQSAFCDTGLEWETALTAPVNSGRVDLGTIQFDAGTCVNNSYGYTPHGLSWKRDGSQISATLLRGVRTFDVSGGGSIMGEEMLSDGFSPTKMQWSPSDDRYLYIDFRSASDFENAIFITGKDEAAPQLLVEDVEDIAPAWLSDGSGFIFVKNEADAGLNIFQYDLTSGEVRQLTYFGREYIQNVGVSPDSTHIVFEKCRDLFACELWIMDRQNPTQMWQIIEGADYKSPSWSGSDADLDPSDDDDPSSKEDSGSDGSGGCFIGAVKSAG